MRSSSPFSALIVGVLGTSAFSLLFFYIAIAELKKQPFILPFAAIGLGLSSLLLLMFAIRNFFVSRNKVVTLEVSRPASSSTVIVLFVWVTLLGIVGQSWVGAYRWQQGKATATNVATTSYRTRRGVTYTDNIQYTYAVNGNNYAGSESLDGLERIVNKPLKGNELLRTDSIHTGDELFIRVNPRDARQVFIERRVRYIPLFLFLLSTFFLVRSFFREGEKKREIGKYL